MPKNGNEKYIKCSGVVLSRIVQGENNLILELFLEDIGITRATLRNAISTTKFGGVSEPTSWGIFALRNSTRFKGYVLESAEIFDDMLDLKTCSEAFKCFMKWADMLRKKIPNGADDNDLLKILYDEMKLLTNRKIPVKAVNFRFIWRWLTSWGGVPDFKTCFASKLNSKIFSVRELKLLYYLSILDAKNLEKLFTQNNVNEFLKANSQNNPKFFDTAANFITSFFNQT